MWGRQCFRGSEGADAAMPRCRLCHCRRYSLEALAAAKHEYELVKSEAVHLFLDHCHMGVGGDDSWSPSVLSVPRPPTPRSLLSSLLVVRTAPAVPAASAATA